MDGHILLSFLKVHQSDNKCTRFGGQGQRKGLRRLFGEETWLRGGHPSNVKGAAPWTYRDGADRGNSREPLSLRAGLKQESPEGRAPFSLPPALAGQPGVLTESSHIIEWHRTAHALCLPVSRAELCTTAR